MLKRNTEVPKEQANKEKTVRHKEDRKSHVFTEYMVTTVLLSVCFWSVTVVNLFYHSYVALFPLWAFLGTVLT